jgi:hypothetical protein
MPRTLSAALTLAKNQVVSTDPFVWVFQVDSPDFPAPLRFVADVQGLTYQGNTYDPFPVDITAIQENALGERQTLQGICANVDQQVIALLNLYWDAVVDPDWTLSIWQVLRSAPDETPVTDAELFEVLSAETDLLQVSFELSALGIPSRQRSTGRRYTTSSGFRFLPRVSRLFA